MSRKEHHVVQSGNGWSVKKTATSTASVVNTATREEAVRIGLVISLRQGSKLVIHGKNGQLQSFDHKRQK